MLKGSLKLPTLQYATLPFVCQARAFLLAQIGDVIFINTFLSVETVCTYLQYVHCVAVVRA